MKRQAWYILLSVSIVILLVAGLSFLAFRKAMMAETTVRYSGLQNTISLQLSKTISGMEMSATNVFNEVEKHLDSPQSAIHALESESNLNPDVRGYFAAFEPNYFKEKGMWFEPYVHHNDSSKFEMTQVGSARHDYTKSPWYVRAKNIKMPFWSDPYYYYDGTNISGHYCTFVKPVYDASGALACVCGADITFEWLDKELERICNWCRNAPLVNDYRMMRNLEFFSIVLDKDGTCLVHPVDKNLPITNEQMLKDLQLHNSGVLEMEVNGVPARVYYGPIDGIDWSLAVVAPVADIQKPFNYMAIALAALAVIAIIVVFIICKRIKYA